MYYVYAYLREDGSPYYIGKGKDARLHSKQRSVHKPSKDRITILLDCLSEDDAFEWERFFIAAYGRQDKGTGILRNKTDGGEGTSGHIKSLDVRQRTSEALKRKGIKPPACLPGCKRSDTWKKKIGESKAKEYVIIDPQEVEHHVFNLKKYCRDNGITYTRMTELTRGVKSHYKGYTCRMK